jgi:O-antigen/teichoic acid export membrane protein
MINRFASNTNEQISLLLEAVRDAYITLSHGLIHLAIFLFPVFLLLLPKYESAGMVFKTIALTVVLYTNSFGYQSLLIAKGEEKLLGRLSFLALGINIFVAFILVIFLKVPYSLVIISTMITYLIYVFLLGFFGRKRLSLETKLLYVLKDVYPIRLFIPYVLSICLLIIAASNGYYIIPLVIFLLLNYKAILNAYGFVKKIIVSPNMIEI